VAESTGAHSPRRCDYPRPAACREAPTPPGRGMRAHLVGVQRLPLEQLPQAAERRGRLLVFQLVPVAVDQRQDLAPVPWQRKRELNCVRVVGAVLPGFQAEGWPGKGRDSAARFATHTTQG
jgi:hypothetical protein